MVVLTRLAIILFSVLYWPAAFSLMLVGATLTLVLLAIGLPYTRVHGWITAPIFAVCVPLSLTRMRVHYHPDYNSDLRSVYTQNHVNLLDGMVASTVIPHAFSGLMNAWQFKIPIYGWLMTMSKGIPVRRGRREDTINEISAAAIERRRIGMSVLTFPEGHRTLDGRVQPFRRGVFMMAKRAKMPVVPIAVKGMHSVNRKGSPLFYPGQTVDVFIGPQLDPSDLSDEDLAPFAEKVRRFINHCVTHGQWPESLERLDSVSGQHAQSA